MIVDITELNMRNHSNLSNWFKDKTALKEAMVDGKVTRSLTAQVLGHRTVWGCVLMIVLRYCYLGASERSCSRGCGGRGLSQEDPRGPAW